ncbi:Pentatricopeptide repeat-containing protein [Raphanus sativus]|uniref:Pentatricopeptide repeat-containing protein At1g52620 n=1 Tax=Raphanus sativus TaxID=3726 RepID=A0A6J0K4P6_RAPSA|nr:pentatricopeptide repeat-containing protein At1g52620 [Raphanus sativus]KAJ4917853.1 Pentatricopeptide repeat-containing protein [Raphanus sativus]
MSKTLLSRIKPLTTPPLSHSPITPKLKKQVNDTVHLLKTNPNWPNLLDDDDDQQLLLHISPLLFDRIHDDVETGVKLFDWLSNRRKDELFSNGHACSSFLKLLARHRVFDEIEDVLGNLNVKVTHEALSYVLYAYAESGRLERALEVYEYVIESYDYVPDVIACNSLLSLLVKRKRLGDARKVYDEMRERADNYSTCILLKGMCGEGKVEEGRKLIEERWGKGCVPNIVFYNTIIGGYCKRGEVEKASLVFKELKSKGFMPTLETFGAMINGFCKKGDFAASDGLLKEVRERGLVVSVWFLNSIMDAKYMHGSKVEVSESMRWIVANGCRPDIATYNILINRLCKEGRMEDAVGVLDEAAKKGLVLNNRTYGPLIQGYCNIKEYEIASKLLLQMAERGCRPDIVTYGILIHGLVASGHMDDAVMMKAKMIDRGVSPDAAIYNMLMSGLCKRGGFLSAKLLFLEMLDRNISPDAYVYATLIDGFIRSGDFEEAKKIFSLSIEKGVKVDVVHHNAMIKGFCRSGMLNEALMCMKRMAEENLVPDEFTYSTIIDGYVKQQDMTTALKIFRDMGKTKCKPNVVTYSSLVNGFCCQGDFEKAEETFKEMQSCGLVPNVVTYTTLIRSFAKDASTLGKAVYYWELMLRNKCVPNEVTFNCLLEGFVKKKSGQVVSEPMGSLFFEFFYKLKSDEWSDHAAAYSSVIVSLSVHGMVKTACRFQDRMVKKGFSPDPVSFAAILHGFCVVGNSKQWKNFVLCNLDKKGFEVAARYSLVLERHFPQAVISEASSLLRLMAKNTDTEKETEEL